MTPSTPSTPESELDLPLSAPTRFSPAGGAWPLVGRDDELAALAAAARRAAYYQSPQVVTLIGAQGTGKSRLLSEWLGALEPEVRVLRARAQQGDVRFAPIARLLAERFGVREGEDTEEGRARFHAGVQQAFGDRRVGEVAHLLGTFLGLRFPDSPLLGALDDDAERHDTIRRSVLRRFFEVDAALGPIVLVLDDLEQADDDTLALLEELGSSLSGAPIVLAVSATHELRARRPRWGDRFVDHVRLELGNLGPAAAAELVRALLAHCQEVPDELVADAVAQTAGNPLFLEELVRLFAENGTIKWHEGRFRIDAARAAQTALPLSVEEAIEARIAALAPEERDLLARGAIFGSVFWLSGLVAMSRRERPGQGGWLDDGLAGQLASRIAVLCERDYLLELPPELSTVPGDVEIVFKHARERELVGRLLDDDRRRRLHHVAAQWMEARMPERTADHLDAIAQHYAHAGDGPRAAALFLAAGEEARRRYANEQALGLFERALMLLSGDDALLRMEALHSLGDVLALTGRAQAAAARFGEMLSLAWRLDHRAKGGAAFGRIGRLHRQRGELEPAREALERARALFESAGDRRGVAGATDDLGGLLRQRGEHAAALEHHRRALALRRALGDRRSIALSLANIGRVYRESGASREALEPTREALEIRRQIGDKVGVVSSLVELGAIHEAGANVDAAMGDYAEALKLAREIGDRVGQGSALGRLADVELRAERPGVALEHALEALEVATALGDALGEADGARRVADARLAVDDVAGALEAARRAQTLAARLGAAPVEGAALRVLAQAESRAAKTPAEQTRVEATFRQAIDLCAAARAESELARCFRALAAHREAAGRTADGTALRLRAAELEARLLEAARPRR